ncbi:hypothetical protein EWM64_g5311 [Hericium alpestre]|uniref:BTB domain-containing protein n=1 Tax=Hericium alpestre TaxID=135208 RepID=A0A4Y9ZX03_9AGAM|nr:hypothetical protein EWM64_g5311 [Hericium alpestre]
MTAVPEIREFGAPFDDHDADVVLRSSDAVDFHVYKAILKKGSRGFADMFAAQPIPPTDPSSPEFKDGLPIIPLSETSHTLNLFLQFLYPVPNPQIIDPNDMALVLDAFRKYVVEGYAKTIELMLLEILDGDKYLVKTGKVYALACCYGLPRVAKVAAMNSLQYSCSALSFTDDDISLLTTRQYHALIQFQSRCKRVARNEAQRRDWDEDYDVLPGIDPRPLEDVPLRECKCEWVDEEDTTPTWFAVYLNGFANYLAQNPHPSEVLAYRPSVPKDMWESALNCPACRLFIQDGLAQFKRRLQRRIQKRYNESGTRKNKVNGDLTSLEKTLPAQPF